jgi:hypothetical protein
MILKNLNYSYSTMYEFVSKVSEKLYLYEFTITGFLLCIVLTVGC